MLLSSVVLSSAPAPARVAPLASGHPALAGIAPEHGAAVRVSPAVAAAASPSVNVSVSPGTICSANWSSCPAETSNARVTVQVAEPTPADPTNFTSVNLLFLLETSPYDGAYDPYAGDFGMDPCAATSMHLCEESSLLRTFGTHAGTMASAIQSAHPGIHVTFGLVDFFATLTSFDDGDGSQFHVDIGNFTPASGFAGAVNASLLNASHPVLQAPSMTYPDSDSSDNTLVTSSITALFMSLQGVGINWSNDAHHVIVWLGSAAPQDPHYLENYCVSASAYSSFFSNCTSPACEPSATVGSVTSPWCVGWTQPTANSTQTIAGYANSTAACTGTFGGCTIDTIDVWDTATDPYSAGWPSGVSGGGPGGTNVTQDSNHILQAGCDLATATGGSWDGPKFFSCGGTNGSLSYHNLSSNDSSILASVANVSFGGPAPDYLAGVPRAPMLQILTAPGVALATPANYWASCEGPDSTTACATTPIVSSVGGATLLNWNWSSVPSANVLVSGDRWTIAFDIIAAAGAEGAVPVYVCSSAPCVAAGAGPVDGFGSGLLGDLGAAGASAAWNSSLPLTEVSIEAPAMPQVSLGVTTRVGEDPFPVLFQPTIAGGIAPESLWIDFGDGTSTTSLAPTTHTFNVGTFTVSARVVDALGEVARTTVGITVLPTLQAWFSESDPSGVAPLSVAFTPTAFDGEAPYSYAWTFGDGATSSADSPSHTFEAGTWNVSLNVTDALGYSQGTSAVIVSIAPPPPPPPPPPPIGITPHPVDQTHGSSDSSVWSSSLALFALAAVAAAVLVGFGLVLYRRRRPPT